MNYIYKSNFKNELMQFIEYKYSIGKTKGQENIYRKFDLFLLKEFPTKRKITIEIVEKWYEKKNTEGIRYWHDRVVFLRTFMTYIKEFSDDSKIENKAIIQIDKFIVGLRQIFTKEELQRLLKTIDNGNFETGVKNHKEQIIITLSVIIKTIYCCGLKIEEIINLDVEDVELEKKVINIYDENNSWRCRQIPISYELAKILKKYSEDCHKNSIGLDPFFYNKSNHVRIKINKIKGCLDSAMINSNIAIDTSKKCLKEPFNKLRNTFVITNLYKTIKEHKNLALKMLSMQKYIGGHKFISIEWYLKQTGRIYPDVQNKVNEYFTIKQYGGEDL